MPIFAKRVVQAEADAVVFADRRQFRQQIAMRGRVHDVEIRLGGIIQGKAVRVADAEIQIAHPIGDGELDDVVRLEMIRLQQLRESMVFVFRQRARHQGAFALADQRVKAVVDAQPVAGLLEPRKRGFARVLLIQVAVVEQVSRSRVDVAVLRHDDGYGIHNFILSLKLKA